MYRASLTFLSIGVLLASGPAVRAADLEFTSGPTVSLTNPAITLTIGGASQAKKLVVNAGNIVVTVATSTTFVVSSASRELLIDGHSATATVSNRCTGGVGRVSVRAETQEEVVTITPKDNACPVSSGGGGGSSSSAPAPASAPTATAAATTTPVLPTSSVPAAAPAATLPPSRPSLADVAQSFQAIADQVAQVRANPALPNARELLEDAVRRLTDLGATVRSAALGSQVPPTGSYRIMLTLTSRGADVTALQSFLKAQGPDVYPEGFVTGYFGPLTEKAVGRFQEKYGIARPGDEGYGIVGIRTTIKINSLLGL